MRTFTANITHEYVFVFGIDTEAYRNENKTMPIVEFILAIR
jgi:hypothetical protein